MAEREAAADSAPPPDDPRGGGRAIATGKAKAVWFNRAWLADRLLPGHPAAAARQAREARLQRRRARVLDCEWRGRPPACTPPGSSRCTRPASGCARSASASGSGRRSRWRATRWSRSPAACAASCGWPGAADALVASHFPADEHAAEAARERLAFEELFLYQAALVSRRGRRVSGSSGDRRCPPAGERSEPGWTRCPFELTGDQRERDRGDRRRPGRASSRCSGC